MYVIQHGCKRKKNLSFSGPNNLEQWIAIYEKIHELEVLFQMKANIQIVLTFVIFKEWNIHLTICRSSIATEPSLLWSFWEAYETLEWQPNSELDDWTSCNFFETCLAPYVEKYQFSEKNNSFQVWACCKQDYWL